MPIWYQATIRYQQPDEKGRNTTITENYLIDAQSYTEAEARAYEIIGQNVSEFYVKKITKTRLSEVFFVEDGGQTWFKVKVQYITFDEKTQKEKKVPYLMLINASDPKEAYDLLKERLGKVQDYIISDINTTPLLEVYPFEKEEATEDMVIGDLIVTSTEVVEAIKNVHRKNNIIAGSDFGIEFGCDTRDTVNQDIREEE